MCVQAVVSSAEQRLNTLGAKVEDYGREAQKLQVAAPDMINTYCQCNTRDTETLSATVLACRGLHVCLCMSAAVPSLSIVVWCSW